jgi:hypothetical protein
VRPPTLAARAPGPKPARARRRLVVNRVIAFILLADVVVLLTNQINHTDRPKVATGAGGTSAARGDSSGQAIDDDLVRTGTLIRTAQFPTTGQRSQTVGGNQLTMYSFELPASATTAGANAKAGSVLAAADVEGCANPAVKGGGAKIDAQRFRLELPDGTKILAGSAAKSPALPPATIPAGKCIRGWISFEVPLGKRPAFLIYSGTSEIRWSL